MEPLAFLLNAIRVDNHLDRAWLIQHFTLPIPGKETSPTGPFYLGTDENGYFTIDNDKQVIRLGKISKTVPFLDVSQHVTLTPADLSIVKEEIVTTIGVLIINALMVLYPYGSKGTYINDKITQSMLNSMAYTLLRDDVSTVEEHTRFENAAGMLVAFSQAVIPSATRKAVIPDEKIFALRDKLLAENKGKLDDPATVSAIQAQLVTEYRNYIKGDPSEDFFITGKGMNTARLRSMGMYGAEPDFYDETKINVMTKSLAEGWTQDDLPMLINASRGGSYARSKSTALGGAEANVSGRIFHNHKITIVDCNTKVGLDVFITDINKGNFVGRYIVGNKTPIAIGDLDSKVGKLVSIRSPAYCHEPNISYCKTCMGDVVSNSGVAINGHMSTYIATFLSIFMALMHTSELATAKYVVEDRIS